MTITFNIIKYGSGTTDYTVMVIKPDFLMVINMLKTSFIEKTHQGMMVWVVVLLLLSGGRWCFETMLRLYLLILMIHTLLPMELRLTALH